MTSGHCGFDIVWIMILAMQDDQFFQTAGDVKFSVYEIAEVSRSQKRAFARVAQARLENFTGLIRPPPVAFRDVWSRDPDLTLGSLCTTPVSLWINNHQALAFPRLPATHDLPPALPHENKIFIQLVQWLVCRLVAT